jgi:cyclase
MIDDDTKIIPGHGPLANKADLMAFVKMLEGTAAEVKAMRDKGLSIDEIQQQGLSDNWQSWTDGFLTTDVWIGIVYSSLYRSLG